MALLMTLMIISLILVMTLRFNSSMRASITNASNLQDAVSLDLMAKSVFNSARAVLSADAEESEYDTLHEDWANMGMAAQYFASFFSNGQGGLYIADHSGRFQINSLLKKEGDEEGELLLLRTENPEFIDEIDAKEGQTLCDGLQSVAFTFFNDEGEPLESWDSDIEEHDGALPRIVSVELEFQNRANPDAPMKFMTGVSLPVLYLPEVQGE